METKDKEVKFYGFPNNQILIPFLGRVIIGKYIFTKDYIAVQIKVPKYDLEFETPYDDDEQDFIQGIIEIAIPLLERALDYTRSEVKHMERDLKKLKNLIAGEVPKERVSKCQ